MQRLLPSLAIFAAFSLQAADSGWINLSKNDSTVGWTPRGEVVSFVSKKGEFQLETEKNVWVASDLKLADFIAELEVKLPKRDKPNFNSGLAFRCTGDKGKPKGYQVEIDARRPSQTGGVYGIGLGGWLYPKKTDKAEFDKKAKGVFKHDEWNHIRVKAVGPRIQTWVNGKPIADFEDSKSLNGYFGIQHHGGGGVVKFRNIRVKKSAASHNGRRSGQ
ncbi:MAG: hypothetical protein CMO80_06595 [Verrucomicrobiales bacterium]|nr:hypothetical protein [Verrucomicrobiales bacterium]|tara:strand:+ start:2756 stop:3409 length:654 start_codon:yes stop_codon:yes gene_type:complete